MNWIMQHPAVLLLGLLAGPLKLLWTLVRDACLDRFTYTVQLDEYDGAHQDLFHLLRTRMAPRRVEVTSGRPTSLEEEQGLEEPLYRFNPGDGTHVCRIGTRWALLSVTNEKDQYGASRQKVQVRILFGSREHLEAVMRGGRQERACPPGYISIFGQSNGAWYEQKVQRVRGLADLLLEPEVVNQLRQDIHRFQADRPWYRAKGLPHRRGYLLEGPPGNGKTSIAQAVARDFRLPLYIVNLASVSSDETLASLFQELPTRALVLLEDIDTVLNGRNAVRNITFSGLLNVLDGAVASDGRILILTTNCPEVLDAALVRPGRVDVRLHIPSPNAFLRQQALARLVPNIDHALAVTLTDGYSMAQVQAVALVLREYAEQGPLTEGTVREAVEAADRQDTFIEPSGPLPAVDTADEARRGEMSV